MFSFNILEAFMRRIGAIKSMLVGACICALIYGFIIRPLYFAPVSHLPGPIWSKLSWYYLAYFDAQLRRNDKIAEWHQKYGPIICVRPDSVSIADPLLMREIYGTSGKCAKSAFFDTFITYGARALYTTLPYWEHRQKRSLITSFYHKTKMYQPAIEEPMRQRMFRLFDQIRKRLPADTGHGTIDIYPMFNCFAFDNVTGLLYGSRHCSNTIATECEERPMLLGLKQFQVWGPLKFNFPLLARLPLLTKRILPQEFHDSLIADGRLAAWNWNRFTETVEDEQGVDDHTLLRRLLIIKDKEGKPLETNYIAVELYDNLIAGQETTAVALTYVAYHLAVQPVWQKLIREELQALPVQEDSFPSLADIDAAPLFDAFIREVYRVNPGSSGRQERYIPDGGKEYHGVYLPPGVIASVSVLSLHNDPSVFADPHIFNPRRWLDSSPEQLKRMERSFFVFGYGARRCIGEAYGAMQVKSLIGSLCLQYQTELDRDSATTPEGMWQSGTMDAVPIGLRCDIRFQPMSTV